MKLVVLINGISKTTKKQVLKTEDDTLNCLVLNKPKDVRLTIISN